MTDNQLKLLNEIHELRQKDNTKNSDIIKNAIWKQITKKTLLFEIEHWEQVLKFGTEINRDGIKAEIKTLTEKVQKIIY